jgi:ATP-dependent protease ClpP protease subunit
MTSNLERSWYVIKNDQQIGPIAEATLREFIDERIIKRTDLIWRPGLQAWIVAEQLFEFGNGNDDELKPPPLPKYRFVVLPPEHGPVPPPVPKGFTASDVVRNKHPVECEPQIPAQAPVIIPRQFTPDMDDSKRSCLPSNLRKNGNYVAAHWRGQLSLPISYWFNGFLGYLASTIAVALVGASSLLRTDFSPEFSLLSMIGAWAITFGVLCWQVVGAWRAATEYSNRNAKVLWAAAAKLSLCAAAAFTLIQFVSRGAPQIREMYSIYLGDAEVGNYSFRVLRDGAELELSGGITFGALKEFKRFVEAMSALKTVHLNSPGGRIEEAQRIGDLIKERELDTYVADSCLSACTIIFLSGKNRFVAQNAKIGFHQPNFAGLTDEERIALIRKEQLRLQQFGLSAEFAKQATKASPDQMWTPSTQELIDEGVATQIVDSSSFAFSAIDPAQITLEKTDALLRAIPMYAAISGIDEVSYQEILHRVLQGLQRGKSAHEIMGQVSPIVDALFEKALPNASPDVLTEYIEMMVKHIRSLNREDPAACYVYLNPQKDDGELLASIGSKYPALLDDQNSIKAKVLSSYQFASDEGLRKDAVSGSVAEIFRSLERRFGKDVSLISKKEIGRSEYFSYCNVMAGFYSEILRLPSDTRIAVLRTLYNARPNDLRQSINRPGQVAAMQQPSAEEKQRVVLYDEDRSDPKGKQYAGSVVWRTERVKASGGQQSDIAVRADIEVPDRKFKMTMSFRRNMDTSLPASHTVELSFILPPDFRGGGVGNVPGILLKSNELARGTPLAGLAVKVTDGFFLVGLSDVDDDRSRNIELLEERSWFDVPLVYANQRRAILAIEKGSSGEQAFANAFSVWGETQSSAAPYARSR